FFFFFFFFFFKKKKYLNKKKKKKNHNASGLLRENKAKHGNDNDNDNDDDLQFRKRSMSVNTGMALAEELVSTPHVVEDNCIRIASDNAIDFFIAWFRVLADLNVNIIDPMQGEKPMAQMQVRKIFSSNAKPLLIDSFVRDNSNTHTDKKSNNNNNNSDHKEPDYRIVSSNSFILKMGDDLRKDAGILFMFQFMNDIWKQNSLNVKGYPVHVMTYKCVAMVCFICFPFGPDFGCIEMVPDCVTLKEVKALKKKFTEKHLLNLVTSAAGSYVAAY
ncbi:phosphatidylinositol 3-kinase, partial [Reticulomyxa filosa]